MSIIFRQATTFVISVIFALSLIPHFGLSEAVAEQKTKRVPALREKVYSQLARAQKLADEGKVDEGLAALDSVKERSSSMNTYEIAMMYNFYGFIYYNENRLGEAISAFEKVINQTTIPESLKQSTTYSLAQLSMANSDYTLALSYLDRWKENNKGEIKSDFWFLHAQVNYQIKDYNSALNSINEAVNKSYNNEKLPKESWLVLKRAIYYSLKQPHQVTEVLEQMVSLYDKPKYWLQLAGMYGEIGKANAQLDTFEIAKQRGFIASRSDYMQLAQTYLMNGLAFKAAKSLHDGITAQVIKGNDKNLSFIAEAYSQAKEFELAIPFFQQAAKQVEHGNYELRLAELYLTMEWYEEAADSSRAALDKGQLKLESNAYVALGMAQYNLQNFDASILAFEQAEKHARSSVLAKQWIKYVTREKTHFYTIKNLVL